MILKNELMFKRLLKAIYESPTMLNWINQVSIFFHGIFITSIILIKFPNLEYSFWMLLKTLLYFGLLAESGLGYTIERAVSAFYAGAKKLPRNAKEYRESDERSGQPNLENLKELLYTTKFVYAFLSIITILILTTAGIALMWNLFEQANHSTEFWTAYIFMILQTLVSLQTIKWRSFMTGTQHLSQLYRFNTLIGIIRIFGYLILLLNNLGIAYLMLYNLCENIFVYFYLNRFVLNWFQTQNIQIKNHFRINKDIFNSLWSVSWKSGLNTWSYFFTSKGIELITSQLKDTALMASYLFTNSILGFIKSFAQSPVAVQYPYFYKLLAVKDYSRMRMESAPRIFLANLIMVSGIIAFGLFGNLFLDVIHADDKSIVPFAIYVIISTFLFLELNGLFHGTFYLTTNAVPFLLPGIITSVFMVLLGFLVLPKYGLLGLVLVQLILNMGCNFWYSTYLSLKLIHWPFKKYLHDIFVNGSKYWIHKLTKI